MIRICMTYALSRIAQANLIANQRICLALRSRWTHLCRERSAPLAQVDQRQHGVQAIGVFGQTTVAHFRITPDALERQEPMLDLGAYRRLAPISLLVRIAERPVLVRPLVGEVLGLGRNLLELFTLL